MLVNIWTCNYIRVIKYIWDFIRNTSCESNSITDTHKHNYVTIHVNNLINLNKTIGILTYIITRLCCLLEKAMAPHSSTLAWKIPWTEDPGSLQTMGSQRVGHDWATSLSLFPFMHWRRKWQPTPLFLPGESQGWGSLVGCRSWGRTESDTTEAT